MLITLLFAIGDCGFIDNSRQVGSRNIPIVGWYLLNHVQLIDSN